jgi:U4/U6.U5 tri-snRNP-associated protein 1
MAETLSVDAVNQMRKALGLPLIPVPGADGLAFQQESKDDVPEGDMTLDERQERGSANFAKLQEEQQKKKEREERKKALKREREMAARNAVIKGLGIAEVEDDLGATDWLKSMNKRQKVIDKEEKARLEAESKRKQAVYDSKDLSGLKVAHQAADFDEDAILTFKDRAIDEGDSDDEFELENRELVQKEELAKRLKAKKFKPGAVYNPNDEQNGMLSQYDEAQSSNFTLDASGQAAEHKVEPQTADGSRSKGVMVSLDSLLKEDPKSDYREAKPVKPIKAKKVKKSKNARKRERDEEDEIFPTDGGMDIEYSAIAPKAKKRNVDDFTFDDDEDMAAQLAAARRKALKARKKPAEIAREIKEQEANEMQDVQETVEGDEDGGLLIDASTEWANSLDPEAMAREAAEEEERRRKREASHHTPKPEPAEDGDGDDVQMSYAEAEEAEEAAARAARTPSAAPPDEDDRNLGDEEAIGGGLGATLKMLKDRHLVEGGAGGSESWGAKQKFLQQRAAREEDAEARAKRSRLAERERMAGMSARDREEAARQANSARDFNESRALADLFNREYRPNIELKYHDEFGNSLNAKEAFKELSHQFHGKGSGKQKQEKRLKKLEEEKKRMASSMLDASQYAGGAGADGKKKNKQAGVRLQ